MKSQENKEVEIAMGQTLKRAMRCMSCGHNWWPRVSNPKRCPKCRSTTWREPQTTNPMDIEEIIIYGEEHSHYSYHYHIDLEPSFSQKQVLSLLIDNLKNILKTDKFNEERGYFEGDEYRVGKERVQKRRKDNPQYFENILRFTDANHIHIFVEKDEGKDLFIRVVKLCFPKAKIDIIDMDDSEIEAKRRTWRISGKYL